GENSRSQPNEMPVNRRGIIGRAVLRGLRKRCPHCGQGALFSGWSRHLDRCSVCGLVYERNPGDTWAFTIIGDRLPVAAIIVLVYFGDGGTHRMLGLLTFAIPGVVLIWTPPIRCGVGILLHCPFLVYCPVATDPPP